MSDKDINELQPEQDENLSGDDSSADIESDQQKGTISADLIRGHINTIILRTLDERDKYGYEIMNEIEEKSHGQYTLKQPTLYSALKRLESQGYIKAYWKTDEVSSGGRRKYFTLTELGREFSEKNQAEWEYSRTVIDSLISDRSFDFSQPAPTHVDFNLLKKSVSRIYTGGGKDGEDDVEERLQNILNRQQSENNPQSQFADQYAQIGNSPVKDEYTGSTVRDVCIERNLGIEDIGKKDEEKAEKPADKIEEQAADKPLQTEEKPVPENSGEQTAAAQDGQKDAPAVQEAIQAPAGQPQQQLAQPAENAPQPVQPAAGQAVYNEVYPQNGYPQQAVPPRDAYYGEYAADPRYAAIPPQGYADGYNRAYYPYPYSQPVQAYVQQPVSPADYMQPPVQPYPEQHIPQAQSVPAQNIEATRRLFAPDAPAEQKTDERTDEEKRIAHENFLKLISEQNRQDGTVPHSDEIDTQKLIYANRPETERDYKKLVNNIFNRAVKNTPPPAPEQPQQQPVNEQIVQDSPAAPAQTPDIRESATNIRYSYPEDPAYEKAASDGLKVNTSASYAVRRRNVRSSTFNKGAALFACAVIVGIILLIEFVVSISLMEPLGVGIMYPVTILILALVELGAFGALYIGGFGRGSVRPATHGYISMCVILTVISILIISLVGFLLDINLQSATDIAVKLIIPSVTALNITIFGVSYYFISR